MNWAIKDFDVFYFDDRDLSWEGENEVITQAAKLFRDLDVSLEIKNQARVHLWYEQRFDHPRPPLTSTRNGIDNFLISCACVGIDVHSRELYAPNNLQEIWEGLLRINPANPQPELFIAKATDYQIRWPWLTIEKQHPM